jgi:hypothetical protein
MGMHFDPRDFGGGGGDDNEQQVRLVLKSLMETVDHLIVLTQNELEGRIASPENNNSMECAAVSTLIDLGLAKVMLERATGVITKMLDEKNPMGMVITAVMLQRALKEVRFNDFVAKEHQVDD